jgi:transposase InsO family protein
MDLALYAVQSVLVEGRSLRDVGSATGRSKSWVQRQVARYHEGGEAALELKRRGPTRPANRTADDVEDLVVGWRKHLDEFGLDAGARTIAWHLRRDGAPEPSLATIHRILVRRGFVTPQPQKRPRNSWQRFVADLPNECWQSDMTHWELAGGRSVEIVNVVDDHSRAVMASVALTVAKAPDVVRIFHQAVATFGLPQNILSDNGAIYTAAYRGAASSLEIELRALGIGFRHGRPYHPQTQGKVERYHQTLKKFLRRQRKARSLAELQAQIDGFVTYYNEERPHQAHGEVPMEVWRARDKATPILDGEALPPATKVRQDKIDTTGTVTLRYRSKLHHIGVGRKHKGTRVLLLVCDLDVRVIARDDGRKLRHLTLDPTIDYQPIVGVTV